MCIHDHSSQLQVDEVASMKFIGNAIWQTTHFGWNLPRSTVYSIKPMQVKMRCTRNTHIGCIEQMVPTRAFWAHLISVWILDTYRLIFRVLLNHSCLGQLAIVAPNQKAYKLSKLSCSCMIWLNYSLIQLFKIMAHYFFMHANSFFFFSNYIDFQLLDISLKTKILSA